MGVAEVLTILFVALKCLDKLDWSWFWCFSPLIFLYGSLFGLFIIAASIWGATSLIRKRVGK